MEVIVNYNIITSPQIYDQKYFATSLYCRNYTLSCPPDYPKNEPNELFCFLIRNTIHLHILTVVVQKGDITYK